MSIKSLNQCETCNNWFTAEGHASEKIRFCRTCLETASMENARLKDGKFLDESPE